MTKGARRDPCSFCRIMGIDNYSGMTYTYSESGNTITENYKKGSEQILTVSHYDDAAKMKRLV